MRERRAPRASALLRRRARTSGPSAESRVAAVRGATQVAADDGRLIVAATTELINELMARNGLTPDAVISVLFTLTPDLSADFPAKAARALGFESVPLICAREIGVPGALPRTIRLLAHVEWAGPRRAVRHVYLHGAAVLREDLAVDPA